MPTKKLHTELLHTLTGHTGAVFTLYPVPEEPTQVLSGSGDGMVVQWDIIDPENGKLVAKVPTNIFSLALLPNTPYLLIGQLQGGIHVVNTDIQAEIKHLAIHKKGVFALYLLDDTTWLSAGGTGVLAVWNADFELLTKYQVCDASIRSISRSPDGEHLALGCSDNSIYIYGIEQQDEKFTLHQIYRLRSHANSVFTAEYSPDGKYLWSGSRDAQLSIWDVRKNYELRRPIAAHLYTINAMSFSPDGTMLATAGRDKAIKIWDAENFELLKVISPEKQEDAHRNSVNALWWSKQNNNLVSASDDRTIKIWKIEEDN